MYLRSANGDEGRRHEAVVVNQMLRVRAPAKLNLFLHVVGRRPDGMHELQTLFQLIDLCDELTFEVAANGDLRMTGDLAVDDNLVLRAARLLAVRTGTQLGAHIHLHKRIPVEAGLGGGSSDAAATLLALNRLWGTNLRVDALADLGLELGADVPLFVRGVTAFGEGVGERLTEVAVAPAYYLLVRPDCSVSTPAVFTDPSLTRNTPISTIARLLGGVAAPDPAWICGRHRNDLEPVVRRRYPAVDEAVRWASNYGPAKMSGSGSCVFALLDDSLAESLWAGLGDERYAAREIARDVVHDMPERWRAYLVRGITRSPALDSL